MYKHICMYIRIKVLLRTDLYFQEMRVDSFGNVWPKYNVKGLGKQNVYEGSHASVTPKAMGEPMNCRIKCLLFKNSKSVFQAFITMGRLALIHFFITMQGKLPTLKITIIYDIPK